MFSTHFFNMICDFAMAHSKMLGLIPCLFSLGWRQGEMEYAAGLSLLEFIVSQITFLVYYLQPV